jgi:iron complex transport system substrate-binding protein
MKRYPLLIVLIVLPWLPACSDLTRAPSVSNNTNETAADPSFPVTVTDGLGRQRTFQTRPRRIVSISPKNTELMFAIGAGGDVFGVTSYCSYPTAAKQVAQVGGFSSKSLSIERIVALEPDLVISAGEAHAPVLADLERLGLNTLALPGDTFASLKEEIELLGKVMDRQDEAKKLLRTLDERIQRVRRQAESHRSSRPISVAYVVWADPLTVAGANSFHGEMIELCGCQNIAAELMMRFPKISLETLVESNPQVIVSSTNHAGAFDPEVLRTKPGWSGLQAVRAGRVVLLDGDLVSRCGPRIVDALEQMAAAIHSDTPGTDARHAP